MARRSKSSTDDASAMPGGALVPIYSPLDVAHGIQAYRRGDIIIYRIRGEPSEVMELIGELDRHGVGDVVALVSHRATGEQPEGDPDVKAAEKE